MCSMCNNNTINCLLVIFLYFFSSDVSRLNAVFFKLRFGQMSAWSCVCRPIVFRSFVFWPFVFLAECLSATCPFGQMSFCQISFRLYVFRSCVRLVICLSGICPTTVTDISDTVLYYTHWRLHSLALILWCEGKVSPMFEVDVCVKVDLIIFYTHMYKMNWTAYVSHLDQYVIKSH